MARRHAYEDKKPRRRTARDEAALARVESFARSLTPLAFGTIMGRLSLMSMAMGFPFKTDFRPVPEMGKRFKKAYRAVENSSKPKRRKIHK